MKTQKERIKELLLKNGQVSNYELRRMYIFRAASRIHELRQEGMDIKFMETPVRGKKHFGIYYFPKPDQQSLPVKE